MSIFDRVTKLFTGTSAGQSFWNWNPLTYGKKGKYELLKEYKGLVYACINTLAVETSKYTPIFKRPDRNGEYKFVKDHAFKRLLKRPNKRLSNSRLFYGTTAYLHLTGNAFWYFSLGEATGTPKSIHLIRPDRVKLALDDVTGDVIGYTVRRDDGTEIPLEANEVLHFSRFNPLNDYWGVGTVEAAALYIDTENSTSEFQLSYMQNQATPSGILSFKGGDNKVISTEVFNKLKLAWKEGTAGVKNAGKTLFLREAEATFTKLGLELSDLDMSALKGKTKEDVLEMFRVPEVLLGKTDSSGLGRANVEAVEYIFTAHVIEPELISFDDEIEIAVARFWPKDKDIEVSHVSQIPEDKEAKLREREAGVDKWLTRNEIRAEDGKQPLEGGDVTYYSFNQIPLEARSSREVSNNLGKAIITLKTAVKKNSAEDNYYERLDILENNTTKKYVPQLNKLLNAQQNDVLEQVKGMATNKKKQSVEALGLGFTLLFSEEDITLNLLPALFAAFQKAGEMGLDFVSPDVDAEFIIQQATRDAIFASTDRQMKSFNEQTALKIQKQLAAGLANKEDYNQLAKRIEEIYDEAKGYRAKRIAKTEAHRAVNEGTASSFLQAGYKEMEWEAQPGACEFCKAMDGKRVAIGKSFLPQGSRLEGADGGVFEANYTDINYADLHPECDCKLKPVKVE